MYVAKVFATKGAINAELFLLKLLVNQHFCQCDLKFISILLLWRIILIEVIKNYVNCIFDMCDKAKHSVE